MKAILAFDFGTKSIGMAASHLATTAGAPLCTELGTIRAKEGIPNWDELSKILSEWQPQKVVVGLPLKLDGGEMEITRRARKFGRRIEGKFGYDVVFIDESLSTKAAKQEAFERGHRGHFATQPVDAIAARLILESWLEENAHVLEG